MNNYWLDRKYIKNNLHLASQDVIIAKRIKRKITEDFQYDLHNMIESKDWKSINLDWKEVVSFTCKRLDLRQKQKELNEYTA